MYKNKNIVNLTIRCFLIDIGVAGKMIYIFHNIILLIVCYGVQLLYLLLEN